MRRWLVVIISVALTVLVAGAELKCNVDDDCEFLCFR